MLQSLTSGWQFWAVLAALFAALTALLAKVGISDINSNYATLIRTIVVVIALGILIMATGEYQSPASLSPKTLLFLTLSGLATGASWLCYFHALKIGKASQVAPVDKLSVVFVAIMAAMFLGERLSMMGWTGVGLITIGALLVALG